jgi:fluoroquinolone resistance protein
LHGANFAKASFENQVSRLVYFCSAYITGCNLSYANFAGIRLEKCDLFENRWNGANLHSASLKNSDLSRSEFSEDAWEQFQMQGCDLTHTELNGLNIRRVRLDGVKICDWQQEQLLDSLGVIVLPS